MRIPIIIFMVCLVSGLLVAGCTTPMEPGTPLPITSPPATSPVTTPDQTTLPSTTPSTLPTKVSEGLITDPSLEGTWTLMKMGVLAGEPPVTTFPKPITITFIGDGNLTGFGGCNGYATMYALHPDSGSTEKKIRIGPLISTLMYCSNTSDIELKYFSVLSEISSYRVNNTRILSMWDPKGRNLLFERG